MLIGRKAALNRGNPLPSSINILARRIVYCRPVIVFSDDLGAGKQIDSGSCGAAPDKNFFDRNAAPIVSVSARTPTVNGGGSVILAVISESIHAVICHVSSSIVGISSVVDPVVDRVNHNCVRRPGSRSYGLVGTVAITVVGLGKFPGRISNRASCTSISKAVQRIVCI